MENLEAQQPPIELEYGNKPDGQLGVVLIVNPGATVTRGDETKTGVVLLPWEARLLAYTLLHHAESVANGLVPTPGS